MVGSYRSRFSPLFSRDTDEGRKVRHVVPMRNSRSPLSVSAPYTVHGKEAKKPNRERDPVIHNLTVCHQHQQAVRRLKPRTRPNIGGWKEGFKSMDTRWSAYVENAK